MKSLLYISIILFFSTVSYAQPSSEIVRYATLELEDCYTFSEYFANVDQLKEVVFKIDKDKLVSWTIDERFIGEGNAFVEHKSLKTLIRFNVPIGNFFYTSRSENMKIYIVNDEFRISYLHKNQMNCYCKIKKGDKFAVSF